MREREERFKDLYVQFHRRVYAYCLRRTSHDRVDDAVSEVFLVAWRRIDEVPAGDGALPWLYAVAYKVLGNAWRGQKRRVRLDRKLAHVGSPPTSTAEDVLVTREETRQVLEAVQHLKRTDQEILKLAMWEELSHSDIAYILDTSRSAVKQRLYEARKNLTREYNRLEKSRIKAPAARKGGGTW